MGPDRAQIARGAARSWRHTLQRPGARSVLRRPQPCPSHPSTFSEDVNNPKTPISHDLAQSRAISAPQKIYVGGKNSVKSDGSVRTLKGMARGDYSGEPFWDSYVKYYKDPLFIDSMVRLYEM